MVKKQVATESLAEEPQKTEVQKLNKSAVNHWADILSWGGTFLLVAVLVAVYFQFNPFSLIKTSEKPVQAVVNPEVKLPVLSNTRADFALVRAVDAETTIPEGTRHFAIKYTVEEGDTIISIAKKFHLKNWETILYANYDLLRDDPTFLSPGWQLTIPPTDGIYIKWKEGDSLAKLAEKYYANVDDIIGWPSNHMDMTNPSTDGLEFVMIPGGYRVIQPWIPTLPYASGAGVTRQIMGEGGCASTGYVYIGSGSFVWPTNQHSLSGFDFSSYHMGIDCTASTGEAVYASDSGTVVYAGWNNTGYGNMIMIDHGNGYETLYAHLSQIYVDCGSGVLQGQIIGAAGSTGHSTGSHVHFEVRFNGGFVNPWQVLGY